MVLSWNVQININSFHPCSTMTFFGKIIYTKFKVSSIFFSKLKLTNNYTTETWFWINKLFTSQYYPTLQVSKPTTTYHAVFVSLKSRVLLRARLGSLTHFLSVFWIAKTLRVLRFFVLWITCWTCNVIGLLTTFLPYLWIYFIIPSVMSFEYTYETLLPKFTIVLHQYL